LSKFGSPVLKVSWLKFKNLKIYIEQKFRQPKSLSLLGFLDVSLNLDSENLG